MRVFSCASHGFCGTNPSRECAQHLCLRKADRLDIDWAVLLEKVLRPHMSGTSADNGTRYNGAMGSRPAVSVVINCFNGEAYLREAIQSVYDQTYRNWEIVLFDNGSTDRTPDIARAFDDRLRYYRSEMTIPLGAARTKALAFVKGEFIAFLDADDIWHKDKLAQQMPLFSDDEVGLVYCDVESFNDAGHRKRWSRRKPFARGFCFAELLANYFLVMSAVVIRKKALLTEKIWFREDFRMVEEADLFTRLAYRWKLDFVPSTLAYWRVHSESFTWQRYDLLAEETEAVLDNLCRVVPELALRFPAALRKKRAWIRRVRATFLWMSGRAGPARREILRGAPTPELIGLYVVTFLPARVALQIVFRLKGTIVYPSD